jgi:hypothetical protein
LRKFLSLLCLDSASNVHIKNIEKGKTAGSWYVAISGILLRGWSVAFIKPKVEI